MFIDQFIIVNNTEVKHFKCVQMPTTITDLLRLLQTPSISNSLIAKKISLLHNLKCSKEYGVLVASGKHHKINQLTYSSEQENFKAPQSLCITTFAFFCAIVQRQICLCHCR